MRRLLYLPVLHSEGELGSLASALGRAGASLCGEERWAKHKENVQKLWQAIEDCLASLKIDNLKIYHDGLPAEGELGRKVVAEAAARGSRSHQIVLKLLDKGAELRKTEDASLLQKELEYLTGLIPDGKTGHHKRALAEYPGQKNRLTEERDRFIAERINRTLKEGETAILILGAYHDVLPYLAGDIQVTPLKDREKVMAYFQALISVREEETLEPLAYYVTAPILTSVL